LPKTALTQNGETFYLDGGDIVAIGMHALQETLMTDVYKRRILETLVGFNVTVSKPIESIEVETIDFKHLEKKASQSGFRGTETESKLQKTVRAKCVGLSSIKSKEKFEEKVSELKTLFHTDEFMPVYTYAIQYLDDFIARNYRFEKNKERVILEDDPTNVDNETVNN
jgi:hypothetical protein